MHTHHSHSGVNVITPATSGRLIRWARWYDLVVNLMTFGNARRLREATVALARLAPAESVLEIGCGTGDVAFAASGLIGPSGRVVGIDASPEMIAIAQAKAPRADGPIEFFVQPVEHMAFADASFDVVLSSLMMHHLPATLQRQALAEARRVLKPGGRLVIVDFRRPTGFVGHVVSHFLLHGELSVGVQDIAAVLPNAGFQVQEVGALLGILGFIRATVA